MKASDNIEELKKQLSEIAELNKRISLAETFMSIDLDDLAKQYCKKKKNPNKPVKPEKRPEVRPTSNRDEMNRELSKSVIMKLLYNFINFGIVFSVVFGVLCACFGKFKIALILGAFCLLLLGLDWFIKPGKYESRSKIIERYENEYEEKMKKYNDIVNYNKNVYPRLLEQYNKDVSQYQETIKVNEAEYNAQRKDFDERYYDEYLPNAKKTLEESEKALSEYDGLISDRYYPYIGSLIEILEDGRADSLKEAINVLKSDQYNEQMLNEAREKNRILEQQRQDAEERAIRQEEEERRYRNSMLEAQRRQAAAAERQERDARDRAEKAEREAKQAQKRAQREESDRRVQFEHAKNRYSQNVYLASNATDPSLKAGYEREAANAYADMQKYK